MIINNKDSIKGLFKFSDKVFFENGDLVLTSTGHLFNCKLPNGSDKIKLNSEEDLTTSNGFYPYLLDNVADFNDYYEESLSGVFSNKLITLNTLSAILNYYNTGLTNNGIIGGYFNILSDSIVSSNIYKYTALNTKDCLWTLMMDKNINNGVFKVHRNLPEINSFVGPSDESTWCILRQYTYQDGEDLIRVQEVIDTINPKIIFRSSKLGSLTAEDFQFIYVDPSDHLGRLNYALTLTNSRLSELESIKNSLVNCFRYKSINFTKLSDTKYLVLLSDIDLSQIYTVLFYSIPNNESTPIESVELKIDLSLLNLSISYKVTGSTTITLSINGDNLDIELNKSSHTINSIFGRQFYE